MFYGYVSKLLFPSGNIFLYIDLAFALQRQNFEDSSITRKLGTEFGLDIQRRVVQSPTEETVLKRYGHSNYNGYLLLDFG
jgi:hypothetical protein